MYYSYQEAVLSSCLISKEHLCSLSFGLGHGIYSEFSLSSPIISEATLRQWAEVGKPLNRLMPFCRLALN